MKVTVVVPVFNNSETLEELVVRIHRASPEIAQIVLVDDASSDTSVEIARRLARSDESIHVVALGANRGQNGAIIEGIAAADGEVVVTLDADLQDPPEAIPLLLERLREGSCEVVFAARRGSYQQRGRMFTSSAYKRLLSLLTGIPRDAGLFLAMRVELARRIATRHAPSVIAAIAVGRPKWSSIPVERGRASATSYRGIDRMRLAARSLWFAIARGRRAR
jgi:undecaprenyl-phosphate 4-deoxy-4-formamido-L-arabinose transferase